MVYQGGFYEGTHQMRFTKISIFFIKIFIKILNVRWRRVVIRIWHKIFKKNWNFTPRGRSNKGTVSLTDFFAFFLIKNAHCTAKLLKISKKWHFFGKKQKDLHQMTLFEKSSFLTGVHRGPALFDPPYFRPPKHACTKVKIGKNRVKNRPPKFFENFWWNTVHTEIFVRFLKIRKFWPPQKKLGIT